MTPHRPETAVSQNLDRLPTPTALLLSLSLSLLLAAAGPATAGERSAALVAGRGELRVAVEGEDAYRAPLAEGVQFQSLTSLTGGGWLAAGVRHGGTLLLVRGEGGEAERLPVPDAGGAVVTSPVPLAAGGELVGLAWLAGESPERLSVRAARWEGGAWSEPEAVAGPAAGSQLALSGAVLRDGSTLLVWSAFDGRDDEILWSRSAGNRWSEPTRLADDNEVPDVTPAVAALGEGAVVAWNRYGDGEYAVVTARWTGDGWSAPAAAGPPGSVRPELRSGDGGTALLLYREVHRSGWTVLRLEPGGRVAARAFLAHPSAAGSPALLGSDEEAVVIAAPSGETRRLRWQPQP